MFFGVHIDRWVSGAGESTAADLGSKHRSVGFYVCGCRGVVEESHLCGGGGFFCDGVDDERLPFVFLFFEQVSGSDKDGDSSVETSGAPCFEGSVCSGDSIDALLGGGTGGNTDRPEGSWGEDFKGLCSFDGLAVDIEWCEWEVCVGRHGRRTSCDV